MHAVPRLIVILDARFEITKSRVLLPLVGFVFSSHVGNKIKMTFKIPYSLRFVTSELWSRSRHSYCNIIFIFQKQEINTFSTQTSWVHSSLNNAPYTF